MIEFSPPGFSCSCRGLINVALLAFASFSYAVASPVAGVETLMGRAAFGKGSVLWFKDQPDLNQGAGHPALGLTSGGRLGSRGEDPWGRPDCAFGPNLGQGGAAVAGSGNRHREILHAERGGVIFFIRPGNKLGASALILSRGDWNDAGYFGLRIKNGRSLALSAFDPARTVSKAIETEAALLSPLEWSFVAVSWEGNAQTLEFRWWAGPLAAGKLTEGTLRVPALTKATGALMVGGRRAFEDAARAPITLTGGLITQLAFYEHALDGEMVKDIYFAARDR